MRTYGDVVDDLARSLAVLVATPAPVKHPEHLMVARSAIHDGIRHSVDAIVGARARPTRPRIADLQLDPAGAFRSALHQLPRVPGSLGLADVAADRALPGAWIDGASAALELTKYDESLGDLHPSSRWAPLGDLADLATTLVQIDMDLRQILPGIGLPVTGPLIEVRFAAGVTSLEARTRGQGRDAYTLSEPIPALPWPIRRAADIPVALDRIAAMIKARGSSITMHDFGAIVINLAQSLDDASKILRVAGQRAPEPETLLNCANDAERTRDALTRLARHRNEVMTIGPAEPSLLGQAALLRGAMRSLLNYCASEDGTESPGPARVSKVLARQTPTITSALSQALASAAAAGQLLARTRASAPGTCRWSVTVPPDERLTAVLDALAAITDTESVHIGGRSGALRSIAPETSHNRLCRSLSGM